MSGDSLDDSFVAAVHPSRAAGIKRTNPSTEEDSKPVKPSTDESTTQSTEQPKKKRKFDQAELSATMVWQLIEAPVEPESKPDADEDPSTEDKEPTDQPIKLPVMIDSDLNTLLNKHFPKNPNKRPRQPGSPLMMIVASSAERCVDIMKALRACDRGMKIGEIGKAFARHTKFDEAAALFAKSRCSIVVGTPHRLHSLIQAGSLKLDSLLTLSIDQTRDVKQFHVASMPMVRDQLIELLNNPVLIRRMKSKWTALTTFK